VDQGEDRADRTVIYDIMFKASAETMITIAAYPNHLGGFVTLAGFYLLLLSSRREPGFAIPRP
jgi:hypothetical protein